MVYCLEFFELFLGPGGVIFLYENLVTLKDSDRVIPVRYL